MKTNATINEQIYLGLFSNIHFLLTIIVGLHWHIQRRWLQCTLQQEIFQVGIKLNMLRLLGLSPSNTVAKVRPLACYHVSCSTRSRTPMPARARPTNRDRGTVPVLVLVGRNRDGTNLMHCNKHYFIKLH